MFEFQDIKQYHAQLLAGSVDCTSVAKHYLEKIREYEHLNAFVEVFSEDVLERAKELDQSRKKGQSIKRMHGVIVAIKDVLCYKGHKVSAASGILKDFVSLYTASAVQFLLDEEAIIIGRCNCDEFAMGSTNENSVYGPVLNGAGKQFVSGGSSGGSAVAVQAGMCMISLGTDTGGSVRQPADFCGVFGFKPGYGCISRYGLIAYASSFDQVGIFANNTGDIRLALDVMSRPDEFDSTMDGMKKPESKKNNVSSVGKIKICYLKQMMEHPSLDQEIKRSMEGLFAELKNTGHQVEEESFDLLDFIVSTYYVLTTAEASSNLARYDGIRYGPCPGAEEKDLNSFYLSNRSEGFGKEVKRRIMLGTFVLSTGYYDAYYSKAQKVRRLLVDEMNRIFDQYDAIILPTSPTTAFKVGEMVKDPTAMYLADIYTVFANLTGVPAISIPLFQHSNGMPFGVQLMGDKKEEVTLLDISDKLMEVAPCRRPTLQK